MMLSEPLLLIIQLGILFLLFIVGLEVVLRMKGRKPKKIKRERSSITPEGSYYKAHPVLGFVHQPGNYTLNVMERFDFTAKHDSNGLRVTSYNSSETDAGRSRPRIWIFGCSYTYGWLVNDDETYPWFLQEKLPDYKIENFGVNGYGTLQSYLQFKEAIKEKSPPELVILGYCDFHKKRNTVDRQWKQVFSTLDRTSPFKIPAARITNGGGLNIFYEKMDYKGFPFSSKSALINFLETGYNRYHDSKLKSPKVTEDILEKFNELADENGTTFILVAISANKLTKEMLRICKNKDIKTVDISIDRSKNSTEHTHYPYDMHPSPLAHKKYGEKLIQYLTEHDFV